MIGLVNRAAKIGIYTYWEWLESDYLYASYPELNLLR